MCYLLHRLGWSWQPPSRRAAERDEQAIAAWKDEQWPIIKGWRRKQGAWLCFEDEAGQSLRSPKRRTWGRKGHTPIVSLPVKGTGRVSLAGLIATRPGQRSRLIYRTRRHRGRKGERRGLSEADYAALLDAAHQQLGGQLVVVWDNLNTHTSAQMRRLIEARTWLTVFYLPAYAPELNPVEGVWAHMKRAWPTSPCAPSTS
ncbi:IS630 family transposase [Nonomuraea lactucae]|uniref:IS630 family transposase n=1 Tax=Nonomuraea lactucae TaxID=2249762 RepID=UPI0013B38B93|nr:IS630 family transposase [Nonomuraea lactucae]